MENDIVKKNNVKPIILAIIAILVVALIALGVFYKLRVVGNPVTLTAVALESLNERLEDGETYGKFAAFLEDEDAFQFDMTGNVTLPMDYGSIAIDMFMQEDTDKKETVMDLDVKLNGKDAIYVEGQLDKNALYFAFKENALKYYYLPDLKYPDTNEIDVDSFIDKFVESFRETIKKEDFMETEKEVTVNDTKINAKQYSLKLTNDLVIKLMDKFLEKIEADKELMRALTTLTKFTETELKDSFDSVIKEINVSEDLFYNIYVYKNTAIRFELVDNESVIMIDDYKNSEITLKIIDDYGEEVFFVASERKNEWDLSLTSSDFSIIGTISEREYEITLTAKEVSIKVNGTNDYKEINDGLNAKLEGKVSMEQQGTTITIPYEFDIKLKEIEKVTLKDTTNKVDIDNMSEVENNEFISELNQIPIINMLMGDKSPDVPSGSYDKEVLEKEYKDHLKEAELYAESTVEAMKEQYGSEEAMLQAIQSYTDYASIEEYKEAIYLSYLQDLAYQDEHNSN